MGKKDINKYKRFSGAAVTLALQQYELLGCWNKVAALDAYKRFNLTGQQMCEKVYASKTTKKQTVSKRRSLNNLKKKKSIVFKPNYDDFNLTTEIILEKKCIKKPSLVQLKTIQHSEDSPHNTNLKINLNDSSTLKTKKSNSQLTLNSHAVTKNSSLNSKKNLAVSVSKKRSFRQLSFKIRKANSSLNDNMKNEDEKNLSLDNIQDLSIIFDVKTNKKKDLSFSDFNLREEEFQLTEVVIKSEEPEEKEINYDLNDNETLELNGCLVENLVTEVVEPNPWNENRKFLKRMDSALELNNEEMEVSEYDVAENNFSGNFYDIDISDTIAVVENRTSLEILNDLENGEFFLREDLKNFDIEKNETEFNGDWQVIDQDLSYIQKKLQGDKKLTTLSSNVVYALNQDVDNDGFTINKLKVIEENTSTSVCTLDSLKLNADDQVILEHYGMTKENNLETYRQQPTGCFGIFCWLLSGKN